MGSCLRRETGLEESSEHFTDYTRMRERIIKMKTKIIYQADSGLSHSPFDSEIDSGYLTEKEAPIQEEMVNDVYDDLLANNLIIKEEMMSDFELQDSSQESGSAQFVQGENSLVLNRINTFGK